MRSTIKLQKKLIFGVSQLSRLIANHKTKALVIEHENY